MQTKNFSNCNNLNTALEHSKENLTLQAEVKISMIDIDLYDYDLLDDTKYKDNYLELIAQKYNDIVSDGNNNSILADNFKSFLISPLDKASIDMMKTVNEKEKMTKIDKYKSDYMIIKGNLTETCTKPHKNDIPCLVLKDDGFYKCSFYSNNHINRLQDDKSFINHQNNTQKFNKGLIRPKFDDCLQINRQKNKKKRLNNYGLNASDMIDKLNKKFVYKTPHKSHKINRLKQQKDKNNRDLVVKSNLPQRVDNHPPGKKLAECDKPYQNLNTVIDSNKNIKPLDISDIEEDDFIPQNNKYITKIKPREIRISHTTAKKMNQNDHASPSIDQDQEFIQKKLTERFFSTGDYLEVFSAKPDFLKERSNSMNNNNNKEVNARIFNQVKHMENPLKKSNLNQINNISNDKIINKKPDQNQDYHDLEPPLIKYTKGDSCSSKPNIENVETGQSTLMPLNYPNVLDDKLILQEYTPLKPDGSDGPSIICYNPIDGKLDFIFTYVDSNIYKNTQEYFIRDEKKILRCYCKSASDCSDPLICPCAKMNLDLFKRAHSYVIKDTGQKIINYFFPNEPMFECDSTCQCNKVKCRNSNINSLTQQKYVLPNNAFRLEKIFKKYAGNNPNLLGNTGSMWGLKTICYIPADSFVIEYTGEIINRRLADKRGIKYDEMCSNYLFDINTNIEIIGLEANGKKIKICIDDYLFELRPIEEKQKLEKDFPLCIDAYHYGNFSRFINHSCEPNLKALPIYIEHKDLLLPRIVFFSLRDIHIGEELTLDYECPLISDPNSSNEKKELICLCGSKKCRGYVYRSEA